jgi:hypothetical protein
LKAAEFAAVQLQHRVSVVGEHALDLMISAFDQLQSGAMGVDDVQGGRQAGLFLPGQLQVARSETGNQIDCQWPIDRDFVDLGDLLARGRPALDKFAQIGQKQGAGGIAIQSTDGGERRVPSGPARRQQIVDPRTFTGVMRADAARRFVEEHQQAIGKLDGFIIDAKAGDGIFLIRGADGMSVAGDAALPHPGAGFASAAVTAARKDLIDATRLFAHEIQTGLGATCALFHGVDDLAIVRA